MLWLPELLTDERGKASVEIPLADSITNYRLAASAVSKSGKLGSVTLPLAVFQDFFVDLAPHPTLTSRGRNRGSHHRVPTTSTARSR
ncbi:MAG: alpha-2-macroglobulin family protein [Polyangiaceae bacterium]